jgi:hypothetical protein
VVSELSGGGSFVGLYGPEVVYVVPSGATVVVAMNYKFMSQVNLRSYLLVVVVVVVVTVVPGAGPSFRSCWF